MSTFDCAPRLAGAFASPTRLPKRLLAAVVLAAAVVGVFVTIAFEPLPSTAPSPQVGPSTLARPGAAALQVPDLPAVQDLLSDGTEPPIAPPPAS